MDARRIRPVEKRLTIISFEHIAPPPPHMHNIKITTSNYTLYLLYSSSTHVCVHIIKWIRQNLLREIPNVYSVQYLRKRIYDESISTHIYIIHAYIIYIYAQSNMQTIKVYIQQMIYKYIEINICCWLAFSFQVIRINGMQCCQLRYKFNQPITFREKGYFPFS